MGMALVWEWEWDWEWIRRGIRLRSNGLWLTDYGVTAMGMRISYCKCECEWEWGMCSSCISCGNTKIDVT